MGLYDGIKDVAKVLQQADNIDLYRNLLDLSAQALELQNEVAKLQTENVNLKKNKEIEADIERHTQLFVTRKSDETKIKFCSHCWDAEHKLIQISCGDTGEFHCPHCKMEGVHDVQMHENYVAQRRTAYKGIPRRNNYY